MKKQLFLFFIILWIITVCISCDFFNSSGSGSSGEISTNYAETYLKEQFDPDTDITFTGNDISASVSGNFYLPLVGSVDDHIVELTWTEKSDPDGNLYIGYGGQVSIICSVTDKTVVLSVTALYEGNEYSIDVILVIAEDLTGYVSGYCTYEGEYISITGEMIGAEVALTELISSTIPKDITTTDYSGFYKLEAEAGSYYLWHEYCTDPPITPFTDPPYNLDVGSWSSIDFYASISGTKLTVQTTDIFSSNTQGWVTDTITITAGETSTVDFNLFYAY